MSPKKKRPKVFGAASVSSSIRAHLSPTPPFEQQVEPLHVEDQNLWQPDSEEWCERDMSIADALSLNAEPNEPMGYEIGSKEGDDASIESHEGTDEHVS